MCIYYEVKYNVNTLDSLPPQELHFLFVESHAVQYIEFVYEIMLSLFSVIIISVSRRSWPFLLIEQN